MKSFVKIVDSNFSSVVMHYKLGYNSNPNGMYFCEAKDIFNYLNYGAIVAFLTPINEYKEDGERMYINAPYIPGYVAKEIFIHNFLDLTSINTIDLLIKLGADVEVDDGILFRWALIRCPVIFKHLETLFPHLVNKYVKEWYERNNLLQ